MSIVTHPIVTHPIGIRLGTAVGPARINRSRRRSALFILAVTGRALMATIGCMIATSSVFADGGRVELSQVAGPYRVTVFRAPVPLHPGPIDISVLVQDVASGAVIQDTHATLICRHKQSGTQLRRVADRSQATNQLMSSAKFELPSAGDWQIQVNVDQPVSQSFEFSVTATDAQISAPTLVFIALLPLIFFAAYLLREHIRRAAGN